MALLTFFGCLLTAYGPVAAIFFFQVASSAQLVILLVSRYYPHKKYFFFPLCMCVSLLGLDALNYVYAFVFYKSFDPAKLFDEAFLCLLSPFRPNIYMDV